MIEIWIKESLLFLLEAGVIGAFVKFFFDRLNKKIDKHEESRAQRELERERVREEKEKANTEFTYEMLRGINAATDISVATARAVQRIPDAKCNGDMTAALARAAKARQDQEEFLMRQGIAHLHEKADSDAG